MKHARAADLLYLFDNLQRRVRMLEINRPAQGAAGGPFTITQAFIVGGDQELYAGMVIPAHRVKYDIGIAETKVLVNFGHSCETGSVSGSWTVNGSSFSTPEELADGDLIKFTINSVTAGVGLTAWFNIAYFFDPALLDIGWTPSDPQAGGP